MEELLAGLPTLLALARTGSLSGAAAQLGVPRSTLSRRLARLERHLGIVLAERSTRSFRLTHAAQRLASDAGTLLAQFQTVAEDVRAQAGKVRGRLRMASPPGLGGPFAGTFLARFQREHPEIEVELIVTERQPHLIEDQFDLVLATNPPPGLPWKQHRLGRSCLVAVASPRYLHDHPPLERPEDLSRHVLLASTPRGEGLVTWPHVLGTKIFIQPSLHSNDLPTLCTAAVAGLGLALLPVHLVAHELSAGSLVQVLPQQIGAPLDLVALYPTERERSPVLRAFFMSIAAFSREIEASSP